MVNKKASINAFFAGTGMVILILDTKTALKGAATGIDLCVRTVIPSLFPFIFLSIILTGVIAGHRLRPLKGLCRLLRISEGCESLFLVGILGGYPVGAQCVEQAFLSGSISCKDAQRMVAFCNNCGPAFLFGMAAACFDEMWVPWVLWGIHIISALLTAVLLPGMPQPVRTFSSSKSVGFVAALNRAVRIMAGVCGWVILFRILIAFLNRWFLWLLPVPVQTLICGLLELANGCNTLPNIDNTGLRLILCSAFLSFGGICVSLQTQSVAKTTFAATTYFPGKVIQCCISILLAYIIQFPFSDRATIPFIVPALLLILIFTLIFLQKRKKAVAFRR